MIDSTNQVPQHSESSFSLDTIFKPTLLILLAAIAFMQLISLAVNLGQATACNNKVSELSTTLIDMTADYEKAVYDSPEVDNINKQQFMASEYQFLTQQAIAQLTAVCH